MTTVPKQRPTTAPPAPSETIVRPRRRRRGWWIAAWIVMALVLLVHLGGGWYFSGRIDSSLLASDPATGTAVYDDVEVVSLTGSTITLGKGPDASDNFDAPGRYGLAWKGGTGFLGSAVTVNPDGTVARPFILDTGTPPVPGQLAAVERSYWFSPPKLGPSQQLPTDVTITGMPAWLFRAGATPTDTLAIYVHGQNGSRLNGLRFTQAAIGSTDVLVISYRNDVGTLKDESGRLQYGQTEWRDLDAAVQWAQGRGVKHVVLAGESMGGAIVAAYMENSPRKALVSGLFLDAPMLSMHQVVANGARTALPGGLGVPSSVIWTAERIASLRFGVDWAAVDYVDNPSWVTVPTLVVHGVSDPKTPAAVSEQLKAAKPSLVTLEEFPHALHVESWNVDAARYDALVASFLQEVAK